MTILAALIPKETVKMGSSFRATPVGRRTGGEVVNRRRFKLVGGLLALRFPVFLPDFDQWGFRINCGSGFQSASTQAGAADSAGTRFVHQCHTAIAMRRTWAIPLAVAGSLLLGALVIRPSRQRFVNARPAFRSVSAGSDLNADVTSAHARAA